MDFMTFYAIAVGAFLATLFLIKTASYLSDFKNTFTLIISKYLIYPNLLDRHRLIGPWTYASALLCLAYAVTNVFIVAFRTDSVASAERRAGTLSLINMSFLFLTTHLSLLANALGVSLAVCQRMHRVVGWMTIILLAFHVTLVTSAQKDAVSLREESNVTALIVSPTHSAITGKSQLKYHRDLCQWEDSFYFPFLSSANTSTRYSFECTRP
jgi:hypothetical protein